MEKFKDKFTLEERKAEAEKIREYWSDKIPIVAEKLQGSSLKDIPKSKILCPRSYRVCQFISSLRSKLEISQRDSLFIFFNNSIVFGDRLMSEVYEKHKDDDGFLYVTYSEHETLGFSFIE